MSILKVPMYRENGTRVQLVDLLAKVPANSWAWSIFEFDGVSQMPADESVLEFQRRGRQQPLGLVLTWNEILRFAEAVEYTIDCLVVAASAIDRLEVNKLLADDFQGCEIAIRAIDSTEWILFAAYSTQTGHLFRRKLDTRSRPNWTPVPGQTGHVGRNGSGLRCGFTPDGANLSN